MQKIEHDGPPFLESIVTMFAALTVEPLPGVYSDESIVIGRRSTLVDVTDEIEQAVGQCRGNAVVILVFIVRADGQKILEVHDGLRQGLARVREAQFSDDELLLDEFLLD
jgi:hypothetical protein